MSKIRLKKDFVIPKGTEFECIDGSKREFINGNYEDSDSTGHFIVDEDCIENDAFEFI